MEQDILLTHLILLIDVIVIKKQKYIRIDPNPKKYVGIVVNERT
jgi:hypothetical protein